jgi:hypothetical protein
MNLKNTIQKMMSKDFDENENTDIKELFNMHLPSEINEEITFGEYVLIDSVLFHKFNDNNDEAMEIKIYLAERIKKLASTLELDIIEFKNFVTEIFINKINLLDKDHVNEKLMTNSYIYSVFGK